MGPPSPARPRRAVAVLAAAIVISLTASAGVPLRNAAGTFIHWDVTVEQPNVKGGAVTWYVDPRGSANEPPGDTTERDAFAHATQAWNEAGKGRIQLIEDFGRVGYEPNATDRVNLVTWRPYELGPYTLAVTRLQADNGIITDADIVFNDTPDFAPWSTTEEGMLGFADVQNVAVHELGHVLGLDHSPLSLATMSPVQPTGSVFGRTLHDDDLGALTTAYAGPVEQDRGAVHGTVRIGKRKTKKGVVVFALDARTGRAAGCAFSGTDGRYRIRSLPPGPYVIAAVPLSHPGLHSSYWSDAPDRVDAALLEDPEQPGSGRPWIVDVRAGFPEIDRDIVMAKASRRGSGEPDDEPSRARVLRLRSWAAGAWEKALDEDWFEVPTEGRNAITFHLRATGLGSDGDGELAVFDGDGVTQLANVTDNRPPVDEQWSLGPEGVDRDADITALIPPGTGTVLVRVRAQPQSESGSSSAFYLLTAFPAAGVPDGRRSTADVSPASVRAGEGGTVRITARPRDFVGDALPPGAVVTVATVGGEPMTMTDMQDGTWIADVPIPAKAGEVAFDFDVSSDLGKEWVPAAAVLSAAGPADSRQTTITAAPRRIAADGKAESRVRVTPRDARGRLLGSGLTVLFQPLGSSTGTLSETRPLGPGVYEVTVTAAAAPGGVALGVSVHGVDTGAATRVGFGWDLPLVAADLGAEVAETSGVPGLSRSTGRTLGRAGTALADMLRADDEGDPVAMAAAGAKAVRHLVRAGDSGPWFGGDDGGEELTEALRLRVRALLDPIRFPVPDPKGEKALGLARSWLAKAEAALATGEEVQAAAYLAKCVKAAKTLL